MRKGKKSGKKRAIWIASGCAAALAAVFILVLFSATRPPKPAAVGIASAARGPLEDIVSASGNFKAVDSATVASRTIGRVKSVLVKPGDKVKKGELIVLIDRDDSALALANAEIALEETRRSILTQLGELRSASRRASTALDQARRSLDGAKELKAVDGITAEAWRQANEGLEQAELAAAGAEDALRLAQGIPSSEEPSLDASRDAEFALRSPAYRRAAITLDNARRAFAACSIASEADGTVVEVSVDPGSYVENGTIVARIEDLSAVTAEVNVDEVDIGKLKVGQGASISADSLLGKELKGRVSSIRPVVKSSGSGRTCVVSLNVDLGAEKALSGASCVARVNSRVKEDALIIPASALIPAASPPAVWLLSRSDGVRTGTEPEESAKPADAGKAAESASEGSSGKDAKAASGATLYRAARREVSIGASTSSKLEILSGLEPGDAVAVDGLKGISEGALVRDRAGAK